MGFPEETMVVVHNGVDVKRFCPDAEAGKAVRREWEVKDDERLIGHVARMDPMKDHPAFLRAAGILAEERPAARFVCVGDGSEPRQRELRDLAKNLGLGDRLIWAGPRADIPAVFNALDILCSSSLYGEGFPNVLGEGMALRGSLAWPRMWGIPPWSWAKPAWWSRRGPSSSWPKPWSKQP